jgi:hypothetical protein
VRGNPRYTGGNRPPSELWGITYYDPDEDYFETAPIRDYSNRYADALKTDLDPDVAPGKVSGTPLPPPVTDVCRFYNAGVCKFGNKCRYLHIGDSPVEVENEKAAVVECGICLEAPAGAQYGILSHCVCKFCVSCIREWRKEGISVTHDTEQVRYSIMLISCIN